MLVIPEIVIESPKIAMIGDLHFGIKNGDKYFLDFQVKYMKRKLDMLAGMGIKQLFQAGDALDNRKRTETNVINAVQEVCAYAAELGIEIVFIVGNHNTFYTDTNAVHNLNIVTHMSNVKIVEEYSHGVSKFDGSPVILLLGWIHKNNHDTLMEAVEQSTAPYCLMHAEFDGFEMYKGIEAKGGMSIVPFRKFKRVLSGHYHTVSSNGNVEYLGSPYALTWMDWVDGVNRGLFILDVTTDEFNFIRNEEHETLFLTHEYDGSIVYDEFFFEKFKNKVVKFFVKEVADPKHYDKFVKLVNSVPYIDRRIIDERELAAIEHAAIDIRSMNLTPAKVIDDYVREEAAVNNLNPDEVSKEALSLYHSALEEQSKV